jgi:hypothetical protein
MKIPRHRSNLVGVNQSKFGNVRPQIAKKKRSFEKWIDSMENEHECDYFNGELEEDYECS